MTLFGGTSGVKQAKPPVYTCLQVQTSANGLPIPIFWGTQRLSGNCIDYFNFQRHNADKGKGGKGGKGGNYDYTASVMIALCEGSVTESPITLGRMWVGTSETDLAGYGGGIFPGTGDQAAWSTAAANPPGHTLAYAWTCYYAHADLDLGSSASLPNINFELFGSFNNNNVPPGTPDANMGDIIPDFLCNPRYSLNFDRDLLVNFNAGGLTGSNTSLLVYHYCAGIYVSPLLKDQEQVTATIERWAAVANAWFFWSGTALKCVCLGDTAITAVGPHGENVQYIPNLQPIYDLGPDDFQVADKNSKNAQPPVKVDRKDPSDHFNQVQLNCSIRTTNGGVANSPAYQDTPYRWQDDASIGLAGIQAPNHTSSTEICLDSTAKVVVSLIGQRALYINNEYQFKLLYTFILLEPGDIVTLTEPNVALDKFIVRIKTVEEDENGYLSFTAEEFVQGLGTAKIQEFEGSGNTAPYNTQVDPGSVNAPAFVQPDLSLTGGVPQLWIALSGGQYCGGCAVELSFDGITYSPIGVCDTPSLQGTLAAALPLESGLDTSSTLAIDLSESIGVIPATATEADAEAYRTLCLVDSELLAYGNVAPTGDYTADLTYLERGLYGTTPAAHAPGAPFARIDQTKVFQYTLPAQYIGQELFFLFPTQNIFGNQPQTLDECTEYTYTPGFQGAPTGVTVSYVYSAETLTGIQFNWTNPPGTTPTSFDFRFSQHPSGTSGQVYGTASGGSAGATSLFIPIGSIVAGDGLLYCSMRAVGGTVDSAWSADATLGLPSISSVVTQTDAGGHFTGVKVTWTAPSPAPSAYILSWLQSGFGEEMASGGATSAVISAATFLAATGVALSNYSVALQHVYGSSQSEQTTDAVTVYPPLILSGGPTWLSTTTPGTGEVKVDWSAWTGTANQQASDGDLRPTYFKVKYWPQVAGTPVLDGGFIAAGGALNQTISGLTSGVTYCFAVLTYKGSSGTQTTGEVFNGSGQPTLSEIVTATPP